MPREKRTTRRRPAAAAAAEQAADDSAAPSSSPLTQLVAASVASASSLSLTESDVVQPDLDPVPVSDNGPDTDSDAQPRQRKRRKSGKYSTPLTDEQRLDILRMHINEGKTAASIVRVFKDRGIIVPIGTVYTLFRKQALGLPIGRQHKRTRRTTYTDEDKQLIVQAQSEHNDWRYDQLKKAWKDAHPDSTRCPSNDTIHKWLKEAALTSKLLVPVPKARNAPENIEARRAYSEKAIAWDRGSLVFIDETSFDRGLHSSRGRSKKGTPATYTARNSPGPGLKVCAAVSPTLGLVMYDSQLTAWDGDDFAKFMTRLCRQPGMQQQSMKFVMDNVRVHHTEVVKDAMRGQSIQHEIEFLPTYSPHLNPIEYCFHNWKTEIKHIDQLTDSRTLQQQIDDTRTCITDHLVARILDHVYQYYTHCIQRKPLEEFKPIGHRILRARQEAERQGQNDEEDEKKE